MKKSCKEQTIKKEGMESYSYSSTTVMKTSISPESIDLNKPMITYKKPCLIYGVIEKDEFMRLCEN